MATNDHVSGRRLWHRPKPVGNGRNPPRDGFAPQSSSIGQRETLRDHLIDCRFRDRIPSFNHSTEVSHPRNGAPARAPREGENVRTPIFFSPLMS